MESLSHLFVHCPVVRPAVAWLRGVWAMLVAGSGYLRWMPGSCSQGTTLCGTPAVVRPVLSCGPTYAFCSAVRFGTIGTCSRVAHGQVFSASAVVALASSWIRRAIRLDWLRVSADLAGTAPALPSWCVIHKVTL